MPLVSICIPAFQGERFLEATLLSISKQTMEDWEIIVTEDGSRDRTEKIVQTFAQSVRQSVVYQRHDHNLGLSATRNTGAAAARGEWIAFMDSDDLWEPTHLGDLLATAHSEDVDMVFAGTQPFDHATGKHLQACVPVDRDLKELPAAVFSGRLSILPSATMVRRRCFERFGGFSTQYAHANDSEYWLRLLRSGGRVAYTGKTTCLYRKHAGAMSLRATRILTNTAQICATYADWEMIPRDLARERPATLYRYAARSSLDGDPRTSVKLLLQSLRIHPFLFRSWGLLGWALLVSAFASSSGKTVPDGDPTPVKVS